MSLEAVPLRLKLALVAATLTLLGIATGFTVVYWSLLGLQIAGFDNENRLLGQLVLESAVLREDQSVRIPRVVESYLTDETGVSAAQAFVDGVLIWEGGVIDAPRPLDAMHLAAGAGSQSVDEWRVHTIRDEDGTIVVQVGRPLMGLREVLGPFDAIAWPITFVLAGVSGLLAWAIVGIALRPLRRLSEAAERFEEGSAVPRLTGRDEPARLARSFAALLGRLQAERLREHRFLALAAHELRTPISALRAGLESAQAERIEIGPLQLKRFLKEARRLETLAQNLLALSRAEAGDARFEEVDLFTIVADAYDRFQPLALERGVELVIHAESAPVRGDPRLLSRAIDNLVSNALRFTTSGVIELVSASDAERAYLEVNDTGPGVREPVQEGLGLRVVRAVARVHGGEFDLSMRDGTKARVSIPANRSAPT